MTPDPLAKTLSHTFSLEYRALVARVHELAAPLDDTDFWRRPFPYGNSFGHLVLHLTGNLNYYIGAQVAETGYLRDRDREFTETDRPAKAVALRRLDEAVAMVVAAAERQSREDWTRSYSGKGEPDAHCRFDIFLKCAVHFYHHVGQMVFLTKALTTSPRNAPELT